MDKNNILMILVILLMVVSVVSPIFFYVKSTQHQVVRDAGGGAVASVSVFVPAECGDGLCELDESCSSCPFDCGECPPEVPPTGSSGGSGGGRSSSTSIRENFKFSPAIIQEQMFQGDAMYSLINLTNTGKESLNIDLSIINLRDFVFLDEDSFYLRSGETEEFKVLISIPEDAEPKVFLGDIVGEAGSVEKSLPIVLRIAERDSPFRLYVNITDETKIVQPGEKVKANINIFNSLGAVSVFLDTSMRDRKESVLLDSADLVGLNSGMNVFPGEFVVPFDTDPDYYLFFVNLTYDGKNYVDAATFRVESPTRVTGFGVWQYIWILLLLILISVIIYFVRKYLLKKKKFFISKKKKKKKEKEVSVVPFVHELELLRTKAKKKYEHSLVDNYFNIIRDFFSRYYALKHSLTFEEMVVELNKRQINRKKKIIEFIDRIAHIPYTYSLIPKDKFISLLDESISLLNSYKRKTKPVAKVRRKRKIVRKKR